MASLVVDAVSVSAGGQEPSHGDEQEALMPYLALTTLRVRLPTGAELAISMVKQSTEGIPLAAVACLNHTRPYACTSPRPLVVSLPMLTATRPAIRPTK